MNIPINDNFALTKLFADDLPSALQHLADSDIAAATIGIPHPYTGDDFASMMAKAEAAELECGYPMYLAIREADGLMIGAIKFCEVIGEGVWEIGYWLAMPWWGRGIMTKAVRAACDHAFFKWDVGVVFASVIEGSTASERVLLKNGFIYDGPTVLRKDGQDVAGRVFVLEAPPF